MEDKSFLWLMRLLFKKDLEFPTLETYVFQNQNCVYYFSDKLSFIDLRKQDTDVKSILQGVLDDFYSKTRFKSKDSLVCYSIHNKKRTKLFGADFVQTMNSALLFPYVIQIPKNSETASNFFTFKVEYTRFGYSTKLLLQTEAGEKELLDNQVLDTCSDLAKTIMFLIEDFVQKRVMTLELEFLESNNHFYFAYAKQIKIAKPEVCLEKPIQRPLDLQEIPIKTTTGQKCDKLMRGISVKKPRKSPVKEESKYLYRNGHIRNKESCFNHPLEILHPLESKSQQQLPNPSIPKKVLLSFSTSLKKLKLHSTVNKTTKRKTEQKQSPSQTTKPKTKPRPEKSNLLKAMENNITIKKLRRNYLRGKTPDSQSNTKRKIIFLPP